jgi:hypothetical protein
VAWSAVPNGRKGTANVFTLRANDIKRVPEPAEPDADDQEIVVGRCDMRGGRAAATLAEVRGILRGEGMMLPYWRSAIGLRSVPALLSAIQGGRRLGVGAEETVGHVPAAAGNCETSEARGLRLTLRALGIAGTYEASRATRSIEAVDPQIVLCNGQTTPAGVQRCTWAEAVSTCRCGLLLDVAELEGGRAQLTVGMRRKKCGEDGKYAVAKTEHKRKRESALAGAGLEQLTNTP